MMRAFPEHYLLPRVLNGVKDSPRDSAILHIGTFCAMRPAEVFGLYWGSFRGDHFVIRNSAWEGKLLADQAKVEEHRVYVHQLRGPKSCAGVKRRRAFGLTI